MAIIPTYAKLRSLPMEELIRLYDSAAPHAEVGVSYLRDEIARREAEKQTAEIAGMTRQMRNMTLWITALTAVNMIDTVVLFFK